uniref:Uncharacterized protein n=1 Tax=Anguilla anguilla TaxID=7936 RepID=A0A0E9SZ41_ANGAN
MNPNLMFLQLK